MKPITFLFFAILMVCLNLAANAQSVAPKGMTIPELAAMNPLPPNARVKGVVTSVDTGFGSKTTYVVKLDKVLTCELQYVKNDDNIYVEKKGDTIVFMRKALSTQGQPATLKTLAVGTTITVEGTLTKKPNGAVVLKGIASAGQGF